jgi:hypothetical protein
VRLLAGDRRRALLARRHRPDQAPSKEVGCHATSLTLDQYNHAELWEIIRDHWSARENGTHYRRDVTLAEDACRTKARPGAAVTASLRNLAIGVHELERERGRTRADSLKSCCQQKTFSTV